MKNRVFAVSGAIAGLSLLIGLGPSYSHAKPPAPGGAQKEKGVMTHASGTFEVKLTPQTSGDDAAGSSLGRMAIDKQFHGDLEATSKGEMLTAMTSVQGSAGYVAVEQVSGTLKGRRGTFVLQHNGIMNRGEPQLTISVVPDSGTGELAGLTGKMTIDIADGKHSYEFDYAFAGQ